MRGSFARSALVASALVSSVARGAFVPRPPRPSVVATRRRAAASGDDAASAAPPPPPVIVVDGLTVSRDDGGRPNVDDVSFSLVRGERVGLVGRNGCGKSTLLGALAGRVALSGRVERARDARVAYVEQEPPAPSDVVVADALLGTDDDDDDDDALRAVRRWRAAERGDGDPAAAAAAVDEADAWDVLVRAEAAAERLRVADLADRPLSELSGGERKRTALAAALTRAPDVLLLDEPTNHLDLTAVRWLTDLLRGDGSDPATRGLTVMVVTHDRAFLEDVCDSVLELDRGKLYKYENVVADETNGNNNGEVLRGYSAYLEGKARRLALEDTDLRNAKAKYRAELDWVRRQPQARQTKSKSRLDAFRDLQSSIKEREADPKLDLDGRLAGRRIGNDVLSLRDVSLTLGGKVILKNLTYDFARGDRVGVVGPNGAGKTTLLRVLAGRQEVDAGTVTAGETVVFGVYDQMGIRVLDRDGDETVLDFVRREVESATTSNNNPFDEAARLLDDFEFPRGRWQERVSRLSGGERRRLQLLSVLTKRPNFLILDEPTNDVDLDTAAALERWLTNEFQGVLVVVSHDRYFTDRVTNHLLVMNDDDDDEGGVRDYAGTLSDYAECLVDRERRTTKRRRPTTADAAAATEDKRRRTERRNAVRKSRREMDNLERAVEKLRAESEALRNEIDVKGAADDNEGWGVLADLTDEMNAVDQRIEEKETRWMELAEFLEEEEGAVT